jgi:hypothetical protein
MHPLASLEKLRNSYDGYIRSFQFYRNPAIADWVDENKGTVLSWREPFVALARQYEEGVPLQKLVDEGLVAERCLEVFSKRPGAPETGPIDPRLHQEQAIRLAGEGVNFTVTTGTGSGKSFCFFIPIVSNCLDLLSEAQAHGGFRAPVAVMVYPMNALANSQYEDIVARVAGTGLRVCNYTGELPQTDEAALKRFRDLYGRDEPLDCEVIDRETLHAAGCDILLTNYKMLEYALVRRRDRPLFTPIGSSSLGSKGRLRYLVLDEMHTYSGRQGADMALLVRRLKSRVQSPDLRCIGTSATVDSDPAAAATTIAEFASELFGEPFDPKHVIGETFGPPVTESPESPGCYSPGGSVSSEQLGQARAAKSDDEIVAILGPTMTGQPNPRAEDVARSRPVGWAERALRDQAASWTTLVSEYQVAVCPGATEDEARRDIEAALMLGAAAKVPGPRGEPVGLITPKIHSFFSQGLPVTGCLRADPTSPHLSAVGDATCAVCREETGEVVPSYPMVFCAACGQEWWVAEVSASDDKWEALDFLKAAEGGRSVYLMPADEWDEDAYPVDPDHVKANGEPKKGKEGSVPRRVMVCGACGDAAGTCGHGAERQLVEVARPFSFCPACGIRYDGTFSEFNKFFQVGTVGRATATDVLVGRMLDELEGRERKIMAFTDNQQDSSFQAAHLNALFRRFHIRRAFVAGLAASDAISEEGWVDAQAIAVAAYQAMSTSGSLPPFARVMDTKSLTPEDDQAKAAGDYRRYLEAGVLMEASGHPRKSQPTLEDTGLMVVNYTGFRDTDLVAERSAEVDRLAGLPSSLRVDLLRVILDRARRERAIAGEGDALVGARAFSNWSDFEQKVVSRLNPESLFHYPTESPWRMTVLSDDAASRGRVAVSRIAGIRPTHPTPIVRWLLKEAEDASLILSKPDAVETVKAAAQWLTDYGYLVSAGEQRTHGWSLAQEKLRFWLSPEPIGWRCPRCAVRYLFTQSRRCPRCIKVKLREDRPGANDYFISEYRASLSDRGIPLAAEHTGAVPGDERKIIETRFKDADDPLNVVVCTPTMELGVDIGDLAAVYMRNVPPSPANYAQRQGRAGRAAQPSLVVTFCASQGRTGPHDQYFFRFPERIIAGRIAPPRFLIDNSSLVRAHLHSIILGEWDEDLSSEVVTWIDLDGTGRCVPEFRSALDAFLADNRNRLVTHGTGAFEGILGMGTVPEDLCDRVVDGFAEEFDEEWIAFSGLYKETQEELAAIQARESVGQVDRSDERRRSALARRISEMREGKGDFHPLGWLSQRAFLPTYAFPRKAVTLRMENRVGVRVRSRAVALREFAPNSYIYQAGRRFEVVRASLGDRGGSMWTHLALCGHCGSYLRGPEAQVAGTCPTCGLALEGDLRWSSAVDIPDGWAKEQDRVGADSEDRRRQGYLVDSFFRTNPLQSTQYVSPAGFGLTYTHNGRLLQANRGLRDDGGRGFTYCQRCRLWNPPNDHYGDDKDCTDRAADLVSDVVIVSEDDHDMLFLKIETPDPWDSNAADAFAWSLLYALQGGISTVFGVEESEIGGNVFPDPDNQGGRLLLIYEMDEGGVGVVSRVPTPEFWKKVCDRSLEILHVDPSSGHDMPGACDSSCYECLRSFYNQWHHDQLNRRLPVDFLLAGRGQLPAVVIASDEWADIMPDFDSNQERQMAEAIRDAGIPAPSKAHWSVPHDDPITSADLYYELDGSKIAIFLDGSVHDGQVLSEQDTIKRDRLRARGYSVVEIRGSNVSAGIQALRQRLGLG